MILLFASMLLFKFNYLCYKAMNTPVHYARVLKLVIHLKQFFLFVMRVSNEQMINIVRMLYLDIRCIFCRYH